MLVLFSEMSIFYHRKDKHKICYFTILKCTTQRHEAHSQCWATIPTIVITTIHLPKQELCAREKLTPCPSPSHLTQWFHYVRIEKCTTLAPQPLDNPYFTFYLYEFAYSGYLI